MNSTKGKIGRGDAFFYRAFGKDIEEFHTILKMPEVMIIYRFFFEWLERDAAHDIAMKLFGNDDICKWSTSNWQRTYTKTKNTVSKDEWLKIENYIQENNFKQMPLWATQKANNLLEFYFNNRKCMQDSTCNLFKMKQEYNIIAKKQ